jgi:hypothetical protein
VDRESRNVEDGKTDAFKEPWVPWVSFGWIQDSCLEEMQCEARQPGWSNALPMMEGILETWLKICYSPLPQIHQVETYMYTLADYFSHICNMLMLFNCKPADLKHWLPDIHV